MFKDDIDLVHEAIGKYGLQLPFVDLGGLHAKDITVADYSLTINDPDHDQWKRYLHLDQDPFADIAGDYQVLNPQYGDPPIQELPAIFPEAFGTIVCLSVLEHTENPFEIFDGFRKLLKPEGLLILSTEFEFPYHPSDGLDSWRFSPSGLESLARHAGLNILEADWRLDITAEMGVKEIHTGTGQIVKSTYIVARK